MNRWVLVVGMVIVLFLAGCAPAMFGPPSEQTGSLSEQERLANMEAHRARQEALRHQREEQARLRAMEEEARLAREAEEDRLRRQRIEAIHRGKGRYGDLLRVRLEGGQLKFHDSHKAYHPVNFQIAAGEIRQVEVVSRKGQRAAMVVGYDNGHLLLDETPNASRSHAVRLPYEDAWKGGATYAGLSADGPLRMRGAKATIQIVGTPPQGHHHGPQPPPGAVEGPRAPKHPKPEPIIISRPPPRVQVVFRRGHLKLHKGSAPLVSQTVDLRAGQARAITLRSRHGDLKIRVSYLEGEVLIDDAPGKKNNDIRLEFVPGWKAGQSYFIKDSANRFMENMEIFIQALGPR